MHGATARDIETEFDALKAEVRAAVEAELVARIESYADTPVRRAAAYAVCGGGHRWRAIAAAAAGRIFREDALLVLLPGACGVELAHAASMLLDDLPSMDDANFRRGKPAAHTVFPAWAIDMAPVFMLTMAYHMSLENPRAPVERRVAAAILLSRAGQEMIAGQVSDLADDHHDEAGILARYRAKTGALYAAATTAGGVLCGAEEDEARMLHDAGVNLGLSCQLLDDVADVVAGLDEVGKEAGSDKGKTTAIDLYGLEGTRRKAREFQDAAEADLAGFGREADLLRALISQASWKAW
jgi:geranylgeranyl diphosphate synthase type II